MSYFRADKRDFSPNDKIQSAQDYYGKFSPISKAIEDTLEAHRPSRKIQRTSCVFVFEEEKCAKKHWSKMSNGKLYSILLDDDLILHRGDMALMDEMKKLLECGKDISDLVIKYWAGELSSKPEIEVLAASVEVKEVLSKCENERISYLRERWGIKS